MAIRNTETNATATVEQAALPAAPAPTHPIQDQGAIIAILQEQLRMQTAQIEALSAAQPKPQVGPTLEEQKRVYTYIRFRAWAKDKNDMPRCLTMGEMAQMHVEIANNRLVPISHRECAKLYGLDIAADGSLMFNGKAVPGTSDEDYAGRGAGIGSLASRVANLTKRAEDMQRRYGTRCVLSAQNDLDAWEREIDTQEARIRESMQQQTPAGA